MAARDSHIFPSEGALTPERKHQLQSRGNRKWRWQSSFVVSSFTKKVCNACCYSNETVARQLRSHRNCYLPVSWRASFSSLAFWMHCVVQIWWNSCLLQCWLHKAQPTTHPQTLTNQLEPVSTSCCVSDHGRGVWKWWQPLSSSSAGGERKHLHPTLIANCSNCTTEVFQKSIFSRHEPAQYD